MSPILFNLALEPLSRYLLDTTDLHGIKIGQIAVITALFLDDILLFSSNPKHDVTKFRKFLSYMVASRG